MNQQEIHSIVTTQRRFFFSGKTQSVDTRIAALKNLQCAIQKYRAGNQRRTPPRSGKKSL